MYVFVCYPGTGTSREYIAVETPYDEVVTVNGDTLRYGTTPYEMAVQLGLRQERANIRYFSIIMNELNPPRTVYGIIERSPENVTVEIHSRDSVLVFDLGVFPNPTGRAKYTTKIVDPPDLYYDEGRYLTGKKVAHLPVRHRRKLKDIRFENSFRKGAVNISLSLPWTQFYSILPSVRNERFYGHGFIGIGAGVEYLYKDKAGVALEYNWMLNSFIPVLAHLDIWYSGPYEHSYAMTLSLAEYRHLRRFTFGYGVCFTRNAWSYNYRDEPLEEGGEVPPTFGTDSLYERYWSAGAVASTYVNFTPKIIFGVTYRPTFYRFTRSLQFCYEHTISLDLKFYLLNK